MSVIHAKWMKAASETACFHLVLPIAYTDVFLMYGPIPVTMTSFPAIPRPRASVNSNKLAKRLRRLVGRAIEDFNMIEADDRVMVCLSGGKDSYTMLDLLLALQRTAPVPFELLAVNLDQKQPGFPREVLPAYLEAEGVPFRIIEQDTYRVVKRVIPEGRTMCSLCSRLRRGALYRFAKEHGMTKIALGHHRDDIIETLFLNMFYGGKLKAMPPKLLSDDGEQIVIRPLAYCKETDIAAYAMRRGFPIIPCDLCGSQQNLQRKQIKTMLADWKRQHPGRLETIFTSLQHVSLSHLADSELFPFRQLTAGTGGQNAGDDATACSWLRAGDGRRESQLKRSNLG